MKQELIPFGKLKGLPLEELANHKDYAQWLTTRPDFKIRYPDIYMFIVNHFHRPDDSPEHNELQVKFLNQDFCLKLAFLLEPRLFNKKELPNISKPTFEKGYDVTYTASSPHWYKSAKILIEIKPTIGDDFPSILRQIKASMPITCGNFDDPRSQYYYCLVLRDYIGVGASREQFIQFFQSQGYTVVFFDDIEHIKLPKEEEKT